MSSRNISLVTLYFITFGVCLRGSFVLSPKSIFHLILHLIGCCMHIFYHQSSVSC